MCGEKVKLRFGARGEIGNNSAGELMMKDFEITLGGSIQISQFIFLILQNIFCDDRFPFKSILRTRGSDCRGGRGCSKPLYGVVFVDICYTVRKKGPRGVDKKAYVPRHIS